MLICIVFFAFVFGLRAQQYALFLSPSVNVGTETDGIFSVSSEFDNIMKSIPGVSNLEYKIDKTGETKLLEIRLLKSDNHFLIGLEVDEPEIVALGAHSEITTHGCDGKCDSYSSFCEFVRKKGKIVGCKCLTTGCCIHSLTSSESVINKENLSSYLNDNFLKTN